MGSAWDAMTGKKKPDYSDWKSGETHEQYMARHAEPKKKPSMMDTIMAPARARGKLLDGLDGRKKAR